jgi:hypothetical protein
MRKTTYTHGGVLGSYVHLSWLKYEKYGTKSRTTDNKTQTLNDNRTAFLNY